MMSAYIFNKLFWETLAIAKRNLNTAVHFTKNYTFVLHPSKTFKEKRKRYIYNLYRGCEFIVSANCGSDFYHKVLAALQEAPNDAA